MSIMTILGAGAVGLIGLVVTGVVALLGLFGLTVGLPAFVNVIFDLFAR